jgi:hypothetical protein
MEPALHKRCRKPYTPPKLRTDFAAQKGGRYQKEVFKANENPC